MKAKGDEVIDAERELDAALEAAFELMCRVDQSTQKVAVMRGIDPMRFARVVRPLFGGLIDLRTMNRVEPARSIALAVQRERSRSMRRVA